MLVVHVSNLRVIYNEMYMYEDRTWIHICKLIEYVVIIISLSSIYDNILHVSTYNIISHDLAQCSQNTLKPVELDHDKVNWCVAKHDQYIQIELVPK